MGRFVRKFMVLSLFVALAMGCSVKEDRSLCPCRLCLDLSEIDCHSVDSVVVTAITDNVNLCSETIYSDQFEQKYLMLVPRSSHINLAVVSGSQGLVYNDGSMKIPLGEDCPPVYMYAESVDTNCEILERVVDLSKNFCRLNILVEDEKSFVFQLVVRGCVDGYLPDGSPSEGLFHCRVPYIDGKYEISLPRQMDASLVLDIDDGTDVLKTFALGEYLYASGYDWKAKDLKDVTVGIDYARTSLTVSVQGWDKVYEFNFVI